MKRQFDIRDFVNVAFMVMPEERACRFLDFINIDIDKEKETLGIRAIRTPCREILRDVAIEIPRDLKTRSLEVAEKEVV